MERVTESTASFDAPVSQTLFARAAEVTPGGVNSPVRAFGAVGGTPLFMTSGSGPYVTDADGREYVDLVCSWGPMILGHAHPEVIEAVQAAALSQKGLAKRPITFRSLVKATSGTTAKGSWRLRITWLSTSNFAVPLAP